MRCALIFLGYTVFLVAIVALAYGSATVVALPFTYVNVIFFFLTLFLFLRKSPAVVWLSFFAHFFVELFQVSPFGILLFSGTLMFLLAYWAFQYVVTTQSVLSTALLSFLLLTLHRVLFTALLYLSLYTQGETSLPSITHILVVYGSEIIATTVAITIGSWCISFVRQKVFIHAYV